MNTLEKVELTASVHYFERFSKSGISIDNSEVLNMADRKMRRRRRRKRANVNATNSYDGFK